VKKDIQAQISEQVADFTDPDIQEESKAATD